MNNNVLQNTSPCNTVVWGNSVYVNLSANESLQFADRQVKLTAVENDICTVEVDGVVAKLIAARRSTPKVVNGVRIFLADNKNVKILTSDADFHGLLNKDALLCLSDPELPLLDPDRYIFPIGREDGFRWTMEESSHMYAYLGLSTFLGPNYYRSHEGIDINLHDARGLLIHPLLAIESGIVKWVAKENPREACILIESDSNPGIYYIYQHMNRERVYVSEGQHVARGETLAHIWGDHRWGHMHFAVVKRDTEPQFKKRYINLLNCFPQLYELWHGDCGLRPKIWSSGCFTFGRTYWNVENKRKEFAYDDIVGYGWLLGDWCTAGAVENCNVGKFDLPKNVRLRKVLHEGTAAEAVNPEDSYSFEIAVENGDYAVRACIGDQVAPSWQEVYIEGSYTGTYELPVDHFAWTDPKIVTVSDGRLTVTLKLKDEATYAGLSELEFCRV